VNPSEGIEPDAMELIELVLKTAAEVIEGLGITNCPITLVCSIEVPPKETQSRPR